MSMRKTKSVRKRLYSLRILGRRDPMLGTRCWLSSGTHKVEADGRKSYPMFHYTKPDGKESCTHMIRVAYKFILGRRLPKKGSGRELSHLCQIGANCWNPSHVIVESHQKNIGRLDPEVLRANAAKARSARTDGGRRQVYCISGEHLMAETRRERNGQTYCGECLRVYYATRLAMVRVETELNRYLRKNGLVIRTEK